MDQFVFDAVLLWGFAEVLSGDRSTAVGVCLMLLILFFTIFSKSANIAFKLSLQLNERINLVSTVAVFKCQYSYHFQV